MKKVFALLLTSIAFQGFAQTGIDTEFDQQCQCNVVTNHFDEGGVSSVHQESLDGKKNGNETVYYPNGQIQYTRTWVSNKLNGESTHFHRDGTLHYKENYDLGVKKGTWSFYDHDGTVMQQITYTGADSDGTYDYFSAGVKYFTQKVVDGKVSEEIVVNEEIYTTLKEEAEAARAAGK